MHVILWVFFFQCVQNKWFINMKENIGLIHAKTLPATGKRRSPACRAVRDVVCTDLADGSLQHGVQASFRRVHVAGDALALDHARELAHVSRHAQDVVEAVGRATADLVVAGRGGKKKPGLTFSNDHGNVFSTRLEEFLPAGVADLRGMHVNVRRHGLVDE